MREHPYIEGRTPEQGTFLPECLDEVVSLRSGSGCRSIPSGRSSSTTAHITSCAKERTVAAETALMFTSYDIRRAISIAGGMQNLMKRMRAIKPQPKPQGIHMPF